MSTLQRSCVYTENGMGALTKTEQQDVDEVRRLLRENAGQDHAQSQWSLGNMFRQGIAVKQGYTEANMWYRKAENLGNAGAPLSLANSYLSRSWCQAAQHRGG